MSVTTKATARATRRLGTSLEVSLRVLVIVTSIDDRGRRSRSRRQFAQRRNRATLTVIDRSPYGDSFKQNQRCPSFPM